MSNYDLNYQYKDSIGRVSGGMTSQDSVPLSGLNEYQYCTLSTTVGYLYFYTFHPNSWKFSNLDFYIGGYGSVIIKRSADLYEEGHLIEHRDENPLKITLSNDIDNPIDFSTSMTWEAVSHSAALNSARTSIHASSVFLLL